MLHDCVNQLAVLGGVSPLATKDGGESTKLLVGDSIGAAVDNQRELETEYDRLLREREDLLKRGGTPPPGPRAGQADGGYLSFRSPKDIQHPLVRLDENASSLARVARLLKQSTQDLVTNLRQNPSAAENMVKMQSERQHVQDLIAEVLHEVDLGGTFASLVHSVNEEVEQKSQLTATIMREEESRRLVEDLMAKRSEIHDEKEQKVIKLDETIAQLKDQLQETKARVALEGKYIKKESDVRVAVASKTTGQMIGEATRTADELRRLTAEEIKCHEEVVAFLDENYTKLDERLSYWTSKNEADTDDKQHELDMLKSNRARDLDTLTKKTEEYTEYQKVCQSDRKRRDRQRKQAQQAVRDMAAAVKIQAWWRGMLVRHKLGPFGGKKKREKRERGEEREKEKVRGENAHPTNNTIHPTTVMSTTNSQQIHATAVTCQALRRTHHF